MRRSVVKSSKEIYISIKIAGQTSNWLIFKYVIYLLLI